VNWGTKTCKGAVAKQKTAEPQGAASLSLAVPENDGRKKKWRWTVRLSGSGQADEATRHAAPVPSVTADDWKVTAYYAGCHANLPPGVMLR
jgi:hypothetical protein